MCSGLCIFAINIDRYMLSFVHVCCLPLSLSTVYLHSWYFTELKACWFCWTICELRPGALTDSAPSTHVADIGQYIKFYMNMGHINSGPPLHSITYFKPCPHM